MRAGYVPFRLWPCVKGHDAVCAGWQRRFGTRPENDDILICRCTCSHKAAITLAKDGVMRPPPGWTADQLVAALRCERVTPETSTIGPDS